MEKSRGNHEEIMVTISNLVENHDPDHVTIFNLLKRKTPAGTATLSLNSKLEIQFDVMKKMYSALGMHTCSGKEN